MKAGKNLILLKGREDLNAIGMKAANLLRLKQMGFRVPVTYVIPWHVQSRQKEGHGQDLSSLKGEVLRIVEAHKSYAVRSSANVEDQFEKSYAGQFQSLLDVRGPEAIMEAITSVWESLDSSESREYSKGHGLSETGLRMSVILQEMVEPVISGVAFNRNPLTGIRETVVEAVQGPGTALMQEGATPFRWIYHNGEFTHCPEEAEIPLSIIEQVVRETRAIASRAKTDVDLEWVWNGRQLVWVQMRSITTLGQVKLYSNRISREMLAGLIKPLIWSINIPLINGVWIDMLTEVIGPNRLKPHDLARPFYYRAYFNMGLLGEVFESIGFSAESLEIMWGLTPRRSGKMSFKPSPKAMRLLPRLIGFVWNKWRLPRVLDRKLPELEAAFKGIDLETLSHQSPKKLLEGVEHLYSLVRQAAYYNLVAPLSSIIYTYLLRSRLGGYGVDFATLDMGLDTPEFYRFNPSHNLENLNRMFRQLPPELQSRVINSNYGEFIADAGLKDLVNGLKQMEENFGHLSDNGNDFSSKPWRESMDLVVRLAVEHAGAAETGVKRISLGSLDLPRMKRWWVELLYRRARRFALYREHISYIYTLGYGLFRPYFLSLGQYFAGQGWLQEAEDIFFLDFDEVRGVFEGRTDPDCLSKLTEERKADMEAAQNMVLPEVIYGDDPPPPETPSLRSLKGTATSRGYCQGRVKVVKSFEDFSKVESGDVLVIPYSDVSWTPLFRRAVGVVAESGGILSHSSIVAREYGIPAVVSVSGALQLEDNTLVRVDGYRGEVFVLDEDDLTEEGGVINDSSTS